MELKPRGGILAIGFCEGDLGIYLRLSRRGKTWLACILPALCVKAARRVHGRRMNE